MATASSSHVTGVDIFGPATSDPKRLLAFYRDVLGMQPTMSSDDPDGGAEFEFADGTTFGFWNPGDGRSGNGYTALFAVDDIDAAVKEFREHGATLGDAFETPVCHMSVGTDPDGNQFYVHQRKKTA